MFEALGDLSTAAGVSTSTESKLPIGAQQAPGILAGQGIAHRSAQAAQHSRNLEKNPHYAGGTTGAGTASNQDNFLYYYHPDHLGSSSYVTDSIGKVFEHLEYFPFGETWVEESSNTQRTPYLFTAKELDEETGLYYFGARYYDPRTSVWQSPDRILGKYLPSGSTDAGRLPGIGGVYNPTNLALYGYGHQSPLRYVDPDGNVIFVPILIAAGWGALGGMATGVAITVGANALAARDLTDGITARSVATDGAVGAVGGGVIQGGYRVYQGIKAGQGIARSRHLGRVGEEAAGISAKAEKTTIRVGGRERVPDRIGKDAVDEVKNVRKISGRDAAQIADEATYAGQQGKQLNVWTRPGTDTTAIDPLVQSGRATLKTIPNIADDGFRVLSPAQGAAVGGAAAAGTLPLGEGR